MGLCDADGSSPGLGGGGGRFGGLLSILPILPSHEWFFSSFCPVKSVAPAALFLAAKVEEQPRKLDYVIKVAHACLHPQEPPPDTRSEVSGAWGPASQPRRCWDPQSDAPRPGALRGGSPFTHCSTAGSFWGSVRQQDFLTRFVAGILLFCSAVPAGLRCPLWRRVKSWMLSLPRPALLGCGAEPWCRAVWVCSAPTCLTLVWFEVLPHKAAGSEQPTQGKGAFSLQKLEGKSSSSCWLGGAGSAAWRCVEQHSDSPLLSASWEGPLGRGSFRCAGSNSPVLSTPGLPAAGAGPGHPGEHHPADPG